MDGTERQIFTVSDIVRISAMSALTVLCSWVTVSVFAVPFTLQTFAIFFSLEFIGGKRGTVSFLVYALLGALGVPVFSGFSGGIGHLFGPTGGYLLGFILTCVIYWIVDAKIKKNAFLRAVTLAAGLIACYVCGTVWFALQTNTPFGAALLKCVVPFIVPDAVKLALAMFIADRLKRVIKV